MRFYCPLARLPSLYNISLIPKKKAWQKECLALEVIVQCGKGQKIMLMEGEMEGMGMKNPR